MTAEPVSRAVPWPTVPLRAERPYRQLGAALDALEGPTPCAEPGASGGWLVERRKGTRLEQEAVAAAVAEAVAGCHRCPVLEECREYALAAKEAHGVWGGLDMVDRPWRTKRRAS